MLNRILRSALAAVILAISPALATSQELEIRFLNVGQGDAVLVRSQGKSALIDAGPSDEITGQLRDLGVNTLDLLIASHNHADHIGGADAVLSQMPVRYYMDNGVPATTLIQARVLSLVESTPVQYLQATPRTVTLGGATLRIIPSPLVGRVDEQNDQSIVVIVEQGSFRALLTGDSEYAQISALLAADAIPDVDVLKAAHHGSRNGVTPLLLSRSRPEVVVISLGAGNSYGHPHASALRYYQAGGRAVYRTDVHGDVVVHVERDGAYGVCAEQEGVGAAASRRAVGPVSASAAPTGSPSQACCRVCRTGKACGDSCIAQGRTCNQGVGCACNG